MAEETIRTLLREALSKSKAVVDEECIISRGDAMICFLLAQMLDELRK